MLPLARFFEKNLREMMVRFQQAGSKTSRKRLVSKGTMVLRRWRVKDKELVLLPELT